MIIVFRGWRREVKPHLREVIPVSHGSGTFRASDGRAPLKWHSATTAYGRLDDLGLSGRFLIELRFERTELENWIERLINEDSTGALELLTKMQGKAIRQVLGKHK